MQISAESTVPGGTPESGVMNPVLLRVPEWEKYPWLRAGFSTRQGGRSAAYGEGELNLGWTAEDNPVDVAANRKAFVAAMGQGAPLEMVTSRQVHGRQIRDLGSEAAPWMLVDGKALLEADGMITDRAGQLVVVLTADCVPVLVADTRRRVVGAFHAGWRGTLVRIVEHGIAEMQQRYGSEPADIVAAIGPCIGACCFVVGPEVRSAFESEFPNVDDLFTKSAVENNQTRLRMDLVRANWQQLRRAGLRAEGIHTVGRCTACSRTSDGAREFFSYRDEHGVTGRMLSGIAIVSPS